MRATLFSMLSDDRHFERLRGMVKVRVEGTVTATVLSSAGFVTSVLSSFNPREYKC
jgi:hypothetical protein